MGKTLLNLASVRELLKGRAWEDLTEEEQEEIAQQVLAELTQKQPETSGQETEES